MQLFMAAMALVVTQYLGCSKQLRQTGYKGIFSFHLLTSFTLVSMSGKWDFLVCVILLEAGWVADLVAEVLFFAFTWGIDLTMGRRAIYHTS